jgi:pyridoxal phosphate enzyme (YggS family)
MSTDEHRQADLVTTLGAVRSRIAAACADSGRDPRAVTLIAVTKTRPASDILALAALGVLDIGESKDQEARRKIAELDDRVLRIRWHLVGRLQTNKARSVASYASAVHSVDRMKLVRALGDAARDARDTPLDVFVQVSLDDDPERGGAPAAELLPLAAAVIERPQLRLRGVMAVPPMDAQPGVAFARLGELSAGLRAEYPHADAISAGMSDDFDEAIRQGSTHVRVGTALLGRRDPTFG